MEGYPAKYPSVVLNFLLYIKCGNSRLKRYKGKKVSLLQRGSNKRVRKRGKVYLLSKYERRELNEIWK